MGCTSTTGAMPAHGPPCCSGKHPPSCSVRLAPLPQSKAQVIHRDAKTAELGQHSGATDAHTKPICICHTAATALPQHLQGQRRCCLHKRCVCGHFTAVRCNQHFPSLPLSAPHQEAVSSPESTPPEPEQQPSARQMRLHPEAIPHKISSPIPHNRHEEVEAGFSFSVRGYSSPPSETPPTTAQLPLVIPSPTCTHQLSGAESEHKPSRVAMVVSAQPPVALTTVRANSSFRHRSPGAPESTSPIRKLHPLRGCVSPQPLAAVKGFRLHTSPPSQSDDSKGAAPPPSPPTGGRNTALPHNTPLIMET